MIAELLNNIRIIETLPNGELKTKMLRNIHKKLRNELIKSIGG